MNSRFNLWFSTFSNFEFSSALPRWLGPRILEHPECSCSWKFLGWNILSVPRFGTSWVFLFLEVPQLSFLMKLASQPSFDEAVSRRSIFSPTPIAITDLLDNFDCPTERHDYKCETISGLSTTCTTNLCTRAFEWLISSWKLNCEANVRTKCTAQHCI